VLDVSHERHVDLHDLGQLREDRQAGVAGADIVDGKAKT
jgi:hypothetical protein